MIMGDAKGPCFSGLRYHSGTVLAGFQHQLKIAIESLPALY